MQGQFVFREQKEMERLGVQNDLLMRYEAPVLARIFSCNRELFVLDVGCNDGSKTVERFSSEAVSKVIGLEYNTELTRKAGSLYGGGKFSFYGVDVEAEDFSIRLEDIMREKEIDGFDVIYLSFVLMHVSDAEKLLKRLRPFLKESGVLLIVEADDGSSFLSGEGNLLLKEFLGLLGEDEYSGNRNLGSELSPMLSRCGYENVRVWSDRIYAGKDEKDTKQAVFTAFFTYFPEDTALLLQAEPQNEKYKSWAKWVKEKFPLLKECVLSEDTVISIGMKILTCTKEKNDGQLR